MALQMKVTGMVISAMPVGDYDKRLVLITRELGKITVFAKSARRQNNRFVAATQPFSFGEFEVYPGRDSYSLTNADITDYFDEISRDIDCMYYGFYMLELAGYFTVENTEGRDMLKLLYHSLRALTKRLLHKEESDSDEKVIPYKLIRRIFELKILAINGEYPDVFKCSVCGSSEKLVGFDFTKPATICQECLSAEEKKYDTSTIYTMQYIISSPVEKLYTFKVSERVYEELAYILDRLMKIYVDKPIKSLDILFETLG